MKATAQTSSSPVARSDHPVLDFLNTLPRIEGKLEDQLQSDRDVLHTLARLGWPTRFEGPGLLTPARELREEIRRLVAARKEERPFKLTKLNHFLSKGASHLKLSKSQDGSLSAERVWNRGTPQQVLTPLAEAAANLLADGDFSLVRRCENDQCVLWFYDRTKSHRRRWCSMSSCGNRHKVAAFRQRRQESDLDQGTRVDQ